MPLRRNCIPLEPRLHGPGLLTREQAMGTDQVCQRTLRPLTEMPPRPAAYMAALTKKPLLSLIRRVSLPPTSPRPIPCPTMRRQGRVYIRHVLYVLRACCPPVLTTSLFPDAVDPDKGRSSMPQSTRLTPSDTDQEPPSLRASETQHGWCRCPRLAQASWVT